jgi:hypothetical protein
VIQSTTDNFIYNEKTSSQYIDYSSNKVVQFLNYSSSAQNYEQKRKMRSQHINISPIKSDGFLKHFDLIHSTTYSVSMLRIRITHQIRG